MDTELIVADLLKSIGENPDRDGLIDTPDRVTRFWTHFIEKDFPTVTAFDVDYDDMVLVRHIKDWSLCEHHLLPFSVDVTCAYIPNGKVIGLSKIPRIVRYHAHRLQVQERLCDDIAQSLTQTTHSDSVAVVINGQHTCMAMRGIESDATMYTNAMHGAFRHNPETRQEFMRLANG